MSAAAEHLPANLPESLQALWADVPNEVILQKIFLAARAGMVVLASDGARFHASVHPVFTPALQLVSALQFSAEETVNLRHGERAGNLVHSRFPLVVLHLEALGEQNAEFILSVLHESVPVVLLHPENESPAATLRRENVILTLANDARAGQNWAEFHSARLRNHARMVVLDFLDPDKATRLHQFLLARNFQVVNATQRLATTFVQSAGGCQLLVIEQGESSDEVARYIRRLRISHESDVLGIVVTGELNDDELRCHLLDSGVDDILDDTLSRDELLIRLCSLSRQQTRSQQIRRDAYRFPGSVAFNAEYLVNVGNKLYASAQRDVITMAMAVIRVAFVDSDQHQAPSREMQDEMVQAIARYCGKNLRETDLFAQAGERDFYALVTCVGRNNIARVFNRLSTEVTQLVNRSGADGVKVRLEIGVTCDLGVSFRSMIERAQQALLTVEQNPDQPIVVN